MKAASDLIVDPALGHPRQGHAGHFESLFVAGARVLLLRAEVLAAAKAYIAALVSHNAAAVPLSDEVWRIENGKTTGDGADALRKSLESEAMQTVQGVSDERWFASADSAVVFYTLLARAGDRDLFMRIAERFRVVDGRLVEIEAVFSRQAS